MSCILNQLPINDNFCNVGSLDFIMINHNRSWMFGPNFLYFPIMILF